MRNVTNGFFMPLCLPVCPHVTTRFSLDGFSRIFEKNMHIIPENSLHLCLHKALKN